MKRTTVMLPDELLLQLRMESRRRGAPVAELVREAVEQYLRAPETGQPLSFFAIGEGDPEDGSERVDEIVTDVVHKRARRRG